MIETQESISLAKSLSNYQIDKMYVGLNDLAISRGKSNIFLPFIDGTIEQITESLSIDFGVAGLTHPSSGSPVPCRLIIEELKRHNCHFTFLRRSFYRDLEKYTIAETIKAIHQCHSKEKVSVQSDDFRKIIGSIVDPLI